MPDFFLSERYPTRLDDHFVVAWWEQRGSGLSYDAGASPDLLTVEQLIDDTIAVTNYLRARFRGDKIYLMGHSGGTFIGVQAAARASHLYHAYIGVAQMSHQLKSEQLAYAYMLERFREYDPAMFRKLQSAPVGDNVPLPDAYMSVRDVAMHRLGVGTTHDMRSVVRGLVLPSLLSREYTLSEKINLWRGKLFSGNRLWTTQLSTDLTKHFTRFGMPIYFLHGVHDYTVSYVEARNYFQQLEAPVKGFYTFHHSAHSPLFEEPARMREIMQRDVLRGTRTLADDLDTR